MPSKSGETSMAMGTRRRRQRQERLWISHNELAKGPGHPFYQRVNELLEEEKFDAFAEKECAKFYAANNGRPSLVPGIYFRLLLVGYFEGIDSERGIAWRAADSFGLRQFLGIGLDELTPCSPLQQPQYPNCARTSPAPAGIPDAPRGTSPRAAFR